MKRYTDKFFCFSPPVMIATFALEIIFVFYTLWRYKLTSVSRLVIAILFFLSLFQLSEFMVCEGALGLSGEIWSRIGFGAITLLPPLGIHLAIVLAKKKLPYLLAGAYLTCFAFAGYFLFGEQAITGQVCRGNYVIFGVASSLTWLYFMYYYGWLVIGMVLAGSWAKVFTDKRKHALEALAIGYILFMAPTTLVNLLDAQTISAIPSIMCGFAVMLAVVMVRWVLPVVDEKKVKKP